MEDSQIIEAFFARSEAAVADVSNTYGSYCAAIAGKVLTSKEDIDEVLNDTWLRAWNSIPPARPDNLRLYLARITRNLAFDRFRSLSREKRGGSETVIALDELSECIGTVGDPENALEAAELSQAVNRFLATLPVRDRKIFLLRYFYLETTEAIGNATGTHPGLVRTVLSRTRKRLKDHLTKEGYLNGQL